MVRHKRLRKYVKDILFEEGCKSTPELVDSLNNTRRGTNSNTLTSILNCDKDIIKVGSEYVVANFGGKYKIKVWYLTDTYINERTESLKRDANRCLEDYTND